MKKNIDELKEDILSEIRPAWMEINLEKLRENTKEFKRHIGNKTKLMAVIKSDAYSHGGVECAKVFMESGADYLGVATLTEALELRRNNIDAPILVFGYIPLNQFEKVVEFDITPTIYMVEQAERISYYSKKLDKKSKIHLKIDTGMSRLGFKPTGETLEEVIKIHRMDNLIIEGIYSHFAESGSFDKNFTEDQFNQFKNFVEKIKTNIGDIPISHISNAAAAINYPEYNLDMVRIGIPLFGVYPLGNVKKEKINIELTYEIKARIGFIKKVKKGDSVGYDRAWTAREETNVITLPIGYGDGYTQEMAEKLPIRFKDKKIEVIGRVCMDQLMVNGNGLSELSVGDILTLVSSKDRELIVTKDMANISKRLPKVYYDKGKILKVNRYI